MKLLYDEEHDILDVMFNASKQTSSKVGYELRDGIVLYTATGLAPIQLTLVNFRRLTQLPVIHFDLLEQQPDQTRQKLISIISSSPLAAFLRIDPDTFYGHVMSPALLDVCQQ
ncbi:MAG: hypothetical protein ACE5HO_09865 [bacterium]